MLKKMNRKKNLDKVVQSLRKRGVNIDYASQFFIKKQQVRQHLLLK